MRENIFVFVYCVVQKSFDDGANSLHTYLYFLKMLKRWFELIFIENGLVTWTTVSFNLCYQVMLLELSIQLIHLKKNLQNYKSKFLGHKKDYVQAY